MLVVCVKAYVFLVCLCRPLYFYILVFFIVLIDYVRRGVMFRHIAASYK